jgi:predicted 3-demethylubiquinone-9 3-methyltransferase (glyoxalase superfamily)
MRILFLCVGLLHVTGCQTMPPTEPTPAATANVSTFLMFQDGNAQQAMSLYASVFPGSHVVSIERYGPNQPGPEGTVKVAQFDLNGHRLMFSDSFVKHGFNFTPSVSLFVDFASAEELDAAFARLAEGGQTFMPLGNYGFSRRFGWCSDRFGVSWQLNLPETSAATRPAK